MALDRDESIETVFLDLSKAYNRVSHQGLISKLSTCGLVTRASNGCPTSFLIEISVFVLTALNLPRLALRSGIPHRSGNSFGADAISHLHQWSSYSIWIVVLFLLIQPVLTPNSVLQESQPIWMLLQNKDYKVHFARDMGFTCLHYRLDSTITLWFCSTRSGQVLHRRTYAHFFPRELQ